MSRLISPVMYRAPPSSLCSSAFFFLVLRPSVGPLLSSVLSSPLVSCEAILRPLAPSAPPAISAQIIFVCSGNIGRRRGEGDAGQRQQQRRSSLFSAGGKKGEERGKKESKKRQEEGNGPDDAGRPRPRPRPRPPSQPRPGPPRGRPGHPGGRTEHGRRLSRFLRLQGPLPRAPLGRRPSPAPVFVPHLGSCGPLGSYSGPLPRLTRPAQVCCWPARIACQ